MDKDSCQWVYIGRKDASEQMDFFVCLKCFLYLLRGIDDETSFPTEAMGREKAH